MLVGFDFAQPTLRYIKGFGNLKRLQLAALNLNISQPEIGRSASTFFLEHATIY
ncbi:hypothetical protein MC7420_5183 [Coleofasciculus chthonoplastes PCC 7420]|uniref:Uncharacterized protein n=1 Tax=Coleofasciculus chthonoplastes PCC 7420 TaxID=118168 RepID=B4W2M0_9CYAN|nr:hypothetical protein MC7420_5183 [Coleofasciculus chthonoplastes PCC 7420]